MSQEQNNNNQKKMNTSEEQEISIEELDELLSEVKEEDFWNACFEQLERMKFYQKKRGELDRERFEKRYMKDGKIVDKLKLFTDISRNSVYYYSNSMCYNKMTGQDTTSALVKYKVGQKDLRLVQTYRELTEKLKKEEPSWEGYCKWRKEYASRYWDRKNEKKPKKD